jgi:hypothetical protein
MAEPPPLPSDRERAPDLSPSNSVRILAAIVSLSILGIGLLLMLGAIASGLLARIILGVLSVVTFAAGVAVWIGTGIVYRKLARDFHEAGADWEDASHSIFQVQRDPSEPRARELAAWAERNGLTYYGIRKLPIMRRLFYMLHFGQMHQRIMKQYQRVVPDSDPLKYQYWRPITRRQERHWQRYFSAHPEFQAFAGGRLYAPWAGLIWTGAMFGTVKRIVRGPIGEHQLLVYDDRVPKEDDDTTNWVDRTRVLVSSPYPLEVMEISPEKSDSKTDVDFESIEFNESFKVQADDKRWAYDVITPRVMDHLLRSPRFHIEFDSRYVVAHYGDRWLTPGEIGEAAELLSGVVALLPAYLDDSRT